MTLCDYIKQARIGLGLSQGEAAKRIEMSQPAYSRIERFKIPSAGDLGRIIDVLRLDPDEAWRLYRDAATGEKALREDEYAVLNAYNRGELDTICKLMRAKFSTTNRTKSSHPLEMNGLEGTDS